MSAKWGITEWRNRSVSRREEQRGGWLGMKNHDPGLDPHECRCGGDGTYPGVRYCKCEAGRALQASDLELLSEAALTRFDEENAA